MSRPGRQGSESSRLRRRYLAAERGRLPELKRIITAFGNRIAMEETLEASLQQLFGGRPSAAEVAAPPLPADAQSGRALAGQAREHFRRRRSTCGGGTGRGSARSRGGSKRFFAVCRGSPSLEVCAPLGELEARGDPGRHLLAGALPAALAAGCGFASPATTLSPKSDFGRVSSELFLRILWWDLGIFLVVIALLVTVLVPENLARWLKNAPAVKPGSRMPDLRLSDEDVQTLVAYLTTLK